MKEKTARGVKYVGYGPAVCVYICMGGVKSSTPRNATRNNVLSPKVALSR